MRGLQIRTSGETCQDFKIEQLVENVLKRISIFKININEHNF